MKTFFETIPFQDARDFERTLCCVQQFVRSRVPAHVDHEQNAIDSLNAFLMLDTVTPADEANRVLICIIKRHVASSIRSSKRLKRSRTRVYEDLIMIPQPQATQEEIVQVNEMTNIILDVLDENEPRSASIIRWRLQGDSMHEIATKLGVSARTVERSLQRWRGLILNILECDPKKFNQTMSQFCADGD
jgi:RNA polymerase sigma factor (sigma-70 family)